MPSRPSPYLDGAESAPQAYPAPPQPDQPSYGTPPAYRARLRTGGSGPQPYAERGLRPGSLVAVSLGTGRQATGALGRARSRRDPAIAAPWERLAACVLDWIIIVAVSVLAFWSPLVRVLREFQAITANYQSVNSPAAQAAINNMARDPANQHALLYWFLGMFGIALAYYWVQHAAWGATIGKRALGMRVVQAADQSRISV